MASIVRRCCARLVSEQPNHRLVVGDDRVARCWWGSGPDPLYVTYHDDEWGMPVVEDRQLFEKLCLEGFQSGLSWITILRKRENFRSAFSGFDIETVAGFGAPDVERLVADAGIVRHRGKIESVINNARRALDLIAERGSLAAHVWSFEPSPGPRSTRHDSPVPSTSAESVTLSKDLKRRGWTFVGPTTVYSFMQAMGLTNDHLEGCGARERCRSARSALLLPQ